jgi:hypothetical protein
MHVYVRNKIHMYKKKAPSSFIERFMMNASFNDAVMCIDDSV